MQFLDNIGDTLLTTWESEDRWKIIAGAGLLVAVVLGAIFFSFSGTQYGELSVFVKNSTRQGLWKAGVELSGIEGDFSKTTDRTGKVNFTNVPIGKEFTIEVSGNGFKTSKINFTLQNQSDEK